MTSKENLAEQLKPSATPAKPATNAASSYRRLWLAAGLGSGAYAAIVAASVPVVWLLAILLLPLTPDVVASALAVALVLIVPGVAILALIRLRWTVSEALVIGFLLGVGQMAIVSLPAMALHLPLVWVVVPHVLVTSIVTFFAVRGPGLAVTMSPTQGMVLGSLGILLVAGSVLTGDELDRSGDNWIVLPFTQAFYAGEGLNEEDPTIDADVDITSRRIFSMLSVEQATMAHVASLDVVELGADYYQELAVVLGALAVFALGSRLGGSDRVGVYSLILFAALTLTDVLARESYGRQFLLRAGEDKFIATFILFPAFALLSLRYSGQRREWPVVIVGALALVLMHPFAIAFVAVVLGSLALAALIERDERSPGALALSALAMAVALVPAILQRFVFLNDHADRFEGENQINLVVRRFDLPLGLVSLDWSMVTHPLMWVAIAAAPLVVWKMRDSRHGAFIALSMLALPAVLFFPPTATVVARLGSPGLLWRFLLIAPYAIVLAILISKLRWGKLAQAGALAGLIVVGIGLMEGAGVVNDGYWDRYQDDTQSDSIIIAGLQSATRQTETYGPLAGRPTREAVEEIDSAIAGEAVILAPPFLRLPDEEKLVALDVALPGYDNQLHSYTSGVYGFVQPRGDPAGPTDPILEAGRTGARKRALFSIAFYSGRLPPMIPVDELFINKPITHVLALAGGPIAGRLSQSDSFELVGQTSFGYSLYEVVRPDESS